MNRTECLRCQRAFPLNNELAAIPDGWRIAFDPERRRVWRICDACGEWNLLGQDASAAALPELEARFAAATKAPGSGGLAPAQINEQLQLLRLASPGEAPRLNEIAASRRQREINKTVRRAKWILIGFGVLQLYQTITGILRNRSRYFDPPIWAIAVLATGWIASVGGGLQWRNGNPTARTIIRWGAGLFMLGTVLFMVLLPGWWWVVPVLLVAGVIAVRLLDEPPMIDLALTNGSRLRVHDFQAAEITMSWDSRGGVSLHDLPDIHELSGPDALVALRQILDHLHLLPDADTTKRAYELLIAAGGFAGVLQALDGFRVDGDGRVTIGELPELYRIALDLALAAEADMTTLPMMLQRKAIEAARVAGIAEKLDS